MVNALCGRLSENAYPCLCHYTIALSQGYGVQALRQCNLDQPVFLRTHCIMVSCFELRLQVAQ